MTSSEDKQGEGFQRTRKALEQLFGSLSDREIRCAVMAYNDAGIHAARSSCATSHLMLLQRIHDDLLVRSQWTDEPGVVDLSDSIWRDLNAALDTKHTAVPESGAIKEGK